MGMLPSKTNGTMIPNSRLVRTKLERVSGFAPEPKRWQRRMLLLHHTRMVHPPGLPPGTLASGGPRAGNYAMGAEK